MAEVGLGTLLNLWLNRPAPRFDRFWCYPALGNRGDAGGVDGSKASEHLPVAPLWTLQMPSRTLHGMRVCCTCVCFCSMRYKFYKKIYQKADNRGGSPAAALLHSRVTRPAGSGGCGPGAALLMTCGRRWVGTQTAAKMPWKTPPGCRTPPGSPPRLPCRPAPAAAPGPAAGACSEWLRPATAR